MGLGLSEWTSMSHTRENILMKMNAESASTCLGVDAESASTCLAEVCRGLSRPGVVTRGSPFTPAGSVNSTLDKHKTAMHHPLDPYDPHVELCDSFTSCFS